MNKRTFVIRKKSWKWQEKTKRNIHVPSAPNLHNAGFISPVFIVLACTAFSGLFYIYSVNQTAVKGISIREAEKEVLRTKKENEQLKIKAAELMSLYNIEEASKSLEMVEASSVKFIDEAPSVAYNLKNHKTE